MLKKQHISFHGNVYSQAMRNLMIRERTTENEGKSFHRNQADDKYEVGKDLVRGVSTPFHLNFIIFHVC